MGGTLAGRPFTDHCVPYYYQIANLLRRKIERGELPPGARIPKELDLAKLFGVSRVPIRQALSLLAADGLVVRERGRGTFVTENPKTLKTIRLTGIIEGGGAPGARHRLLSVEDVPAIPQLVDFFGLAPGEGLTRIQRLPMVEGKPFSYVMNYLPVEMARRIPRADLERLSMLEILKKRLGVPLGRIHQTIEARTADNEVAAHLSTGVMAPVLYVETFVRSEEGDPLEFSQIFYRGDRHKYSVELISP